MAETRGTFILSEVLLEIKDNSWVPPEEVFLNEPAANTGYFGGGGSARSIMDKTSYSSDTTAATPGAELSVGRYSLAATGSSTDGYFGGGYNSTGGLIYSTMDKVTYSTDTTTPVPGAALSVARYQLAATGSSTAGYFGGGYVNLVPGLHSTMDKVTYSSDTTAAVPGVALSPAPGRDGLAATGNSIAGYFGGGGTGTSPYYSTVNKITYSTDTRTTIPGARLSVARGELAATGNQFAGYFGGGGGSGGVLSTVDKLTYSSDTTAVVPGAELSVGRYSLAATGSSTDGYFGGGSPGSRTTMDKISYSTDTRTTVPGAALSLGRSNLAASSARANALPVSDLTEGRNFVSQGTSFNSGYFGGGALNPATPNLTIRSTMDKVTYSTDTTVAVPGANLTDRRKDLAATGSSTAGYFGGGIIPGTPTQYSTQMEKVTYSSDTTAAVPGARLSTARGNLATTATSTSGYFGGGVPGPLSTMDKVTYSTDTRTTVSGANLTVARGALAATGNSTSGYFGGGSPGPRSTMDKVTYSSDTTEAVPGANLSSARGFLAATGNSTAGYFGGGVSGSSYSTMDKISYSTDTRSTVATAALSFARYDLAATGNLSSGYFGGGSPTPSPSYYSTMDKIDYSTDTTSTVPGAALSAACVELAASSSTANGLLQQDITLTPQALQGNTGYFGGGLTFSTMDKVTYSTDTRTTVPGASLSAARYLLAATGSSAAGYFGGGAALGSPVPAYSTTDKVTYSSDTTAAVPGAALSVARYGVAATGNSIAGYFGGGRTSPAFYSTMDKVTYSTDTRTTVPGAALSGVRYGLAATGNSTTGYFGGGRVAAQLSTMDKVTYSSDTTAAVPGANLSVARRYLAATGNSTAGYFGGGADVGPEYSTMDKLTYSTDTTAAVPGAFLTAARSYMGATGNSTVGYFGGGSPSPTSTMDKVTYSSDTTAAVPGASLSAARRGLAASSSTANAVRGTTPQVPIV